MTTVVVAGALANKYRNGGGAWERMSWVVGLRRLGCQVYFVEQISPTTCLDDAGQVTKFDNSVNLAWFRSVTDWFGVAETSTLIYADGPECAGLSWSQLLAAAESAELLINLSGHLTNSALLERIRRKAYVDVDPGFTQFWHVGPDMPFCLHGHDLYFTIGENIGTPRSAIPTGNILWLPTRQPVVLEDWPVIPRVRQSDEIHFTTVASWRGPFGAIQRNGKTYELKHQEFRKIVSLPQRAEAAFEIALDIHSADQKDRDLLERHGWRLFNPREVAGEPASFRRFIQQSDAEFSVAQGIYVKTNSGWFSDRSVRYLASGKPVLVQDTGLVHLYPLGTGLLTFRTLDEAIAGAAAIQTDYAAHADAAREIAEQYFDSSIVLERFLQDAKL